MSGPRSCRAQSRGAILGADAFPPCAGGAPLSPRSGRWAARGVRAAPGASVSPRFSAVSGTAQRLFSQESLGPRDALSSPRATSGLGCCPSHSPGCLGMVLTCLCPEQAPSERRKLTPLLPGPLDKGRAPRMEDCALSGMVTVVTWKGPASPAWGSCLRPALVGRVPLGQEQEQVPPSLFSRCLCGLAAGELGSQPTGNLHEECC